MDPVHFSLHALGLPSGLGQGAPRPGRATLSTHLRVLDPDGAGGQCLCHHLALRRDHRDGLVDSATCGEKVI